MVCFTVNRIFWSSVRVYDATVMSYFRCLYLFWYVWKEETNSYTVVPFRRIWFGTVLKSQGVAVMPSNPNAQICYKILQKLFPKHAARGVS